ncbi:MAG TPA: asparagine synthase (glutamine-hydrolyzing) [Polyangia bacterium]
MCGIAGAAGFIDDKSVAAVRQMSDAEAHRGPDDQGQWTSGTAEGFGVSLAHRRLAIVDLTPAGAQPMRNPATGDILTFNGEIYNFKLLRQELTARGARFVSNSDTEVILHAYAAWGIEAFRRFRGIFAFALWDARQRVLHLCRDPMGVKPLYWTVQGRTLYFASELRALLTVGVERRLYPPAVATFLWHGYVVGPRTIIEGIELLPAACHATVSGDELTPVATEYWTLPQATPGTSTPESVTDALRETIRMQLVSDVPLGVCLSGGVDSTVITTLAAETADTELRTFTLGFDERELDESNNALVVAEALGTKHASLRLAESDFKRQLPAALESIDQPTFDGVNTYFLSRAMREAGMTVALAGTGGDELFGGYKSFVDLPRAARVGRWLEPFSRMLTGFTGAATQGALDLGIVPPQTRWGKLADVVACQGDFVDLYQAEYGLFSRALFARLSRPLALTGQVASGLTVEQRARYEEVGGYERSLHAISSLELTSFIRERLVRDMDAASMAVSLELRVPFLDHAFIEAVAGLDTAERFEPLGKKALLRRATEARIDPATLERPKSGFVLPMDAWCRRAMRQRIDDMYNDEALCARVGIDGRTAVALWRSFLAGGPGLYWSRVWAVFVLLDWCSRHRVSL